MVQWAEDLVSPKRVAVRLVVDPEANQWRLLMTPSGTGVEIRVAYSGVGGKLFLVPLSGGEADVLRNHGVLLKPVPDKSEWCLDVGYGF